MKVTVVGAGVIGLSCAVELEAAGHDVQVIAAASGGGTVSAVAGAIWFPYRAGPPDAVTRWARRTRERLEAIAAAAPEAGVDVLTCLEIVGESPEPPWWIAAAPDAIEERRPDGARVWRFRAPRVEPARFLPWLEARLARPVEVRRLASLDDAPGDLVVNATGLGARALTGDAALVGVAGQTVVAAAGAIDRGLCLADDRDEAAMFYAIPRRDEVVLGGSAIEIAGEVAPPEDPALTARILADAARFGVAHGAVIAVRRGVRPFRPTVRLERAGRVIHCYGHGGAGYTLCFGCAEDVVALAGG